MRRAVSMTVLFACALIAQGQNYRPGFLAADVHASSNAGATRNFSDVTQGDRRELRNASIANLIAVAHGVDKDRIAGGPIWLDLDQFDVIARIPANANRDSQKLMLQSLLAERFKLVVHNDTKPVPGFALTASKKPRMKPAEGKGESGCHVDEPAAAQTPTVAIIRIGPEEAASMGTQTLHLGTGMIVPFVCRNITMAEFAQKLPKMMAVGLNASAVADETALPGKWDFNVKWSISASVPGSQAAISIFNALDKQLGLKLIEKPVAAPVTVVDSVNRKPTDNPPGTAEALPSLVPREFEVVSIKPADPANLRGFGTPARGQFVSRGGPLHDLVSRAFPDLAVEQIVGLPQWADSERFDVFARYSTDISGLPAMDALATPIRALLATRCKMSYHMDKRPLSAYSLVAVKPKLKKADSASRISCKTARAGEITTITCQNLTMALLADRLRSWGIGLMSLPVADATGLQDGWDFSLSFNSWAGNGPSRREPGGDNTQANSLSASDPSGALTLFEALEKQLGLKLEKRERPIPVLVIDHIERPAAN